MKSYLRAGRFLAAWGFLFWAASCAGAPGPAGAGGRAGEGGAAGPAYRRREGVAAFADGSAESAVGLMRAAAGGPGALYLVLREGSETAEAGGPLGLPFEAAAGGTSPARVVINGGGRTVSLSGAGPLLTVGDGVTLTLRNITLAGGGGAPVVEINGKGARLVLGAGAVIRGSADTDTPGPAGWVLVTEGALEMAGGEAGGSGAPGGGIITGNAPGDYGE